MAFLYAILVALVSLPLAVRKMKHQGRSFRYSFGYYFARGWLALVLFFGAFVVAAMVLNTVKGWAKYVDDENK
jgi:hypothetical protein